MSVQEPEAPYRGTTGERLKTFALDEAARDRITGLATRYWELAAYGVLVIFAAVLRFYQLGDRAMHHDESLHGYFSYGFTKGLKDFFTFGTANVDNYKHVPFMHGPFQFIGNGFVMWVFQDGEFQARTMAATLGTALVFMPWLFRKQLGTVGALAAAAFIAISPTLMYYSRFTREDIYTAFWTFGIVIFMWRYIATHKDRYLFLTAGFMAGSFCTKETTFMTVGAFILFMDFMFATTLADRIKAKSPDMTTVQYAALIIGLSFVAWAIAIGWPWLQKWRERYELEELPPEANLVIVMGTLALPQYAAGVQLLPFFGKDWRNRAGDNSDSHIASQEFGVAMVMVWSLIAVSVSLGMLWKPRTWLIAAACFWVPFVLLYTTFFSNPPGFFSGIWGSMDYWISQQDVRRGNQPDYYYFITIPVYEFMPLILSIIAACYYAIRGKLSYALYVAAIFVAIIALLLLPSGPQFQKVSLLHIVLPFTLVVVAVLAFPMDRLTRFLMYWAVITAFALTVAGEKMPWLNVHIALPLAVLAGKFVGEFLQRTDLRDDLPRIERFAPYMYAAIASALAILVFVIIGWRSPAAIGGWILVIVAFVSVYWSYRGYSKRTALQVSLVGFVAAASVFTLRAGILASWGHPDNTTYLDSVLTTKDHGEVPDELLVYTQTSGDIPALMSRIDAYAKQSGLGKNLPIEVDPIDGYTWPWAWYLRNYKAVNYPSMSSAYTPPEHAVVLASKDDAQNVQVGGAYGQPIPYHHRRWFPEEYRGADGQYSSRNFFQDLFSGEVKYWLDFWVRRTLPAPVGDSDAVAFFPADFSGAPTQPVGPTVRTEGTQLVIGGTGTAPGQLNAPADVAFDAQGNIYVADSATGNSRIQKYDANGNFVAAAGGFGSDVQLNQPWSMAVAPDGTVYVADTWNHRIVKLDKDLKQIKTWGSGCTDLTSCTPLQLFGPRAIVVEPSGNILIADTGNDRIIEYTPDGDFVRQTGGKDEDPNATLKLREPTGLAVAPNGDIYIADFWHQRIVVLDKDFNQKSEIPVPSWGSFNVTDRPYLALLPDGRLLATDPNPCGSVGCTSSSDGNVLVFDPTGKQIASYKLPREGQSPLERPVGIATDGTSVLVADAAGNVVRKIPLSEVVK
jgi:predicted membrane-bound mannosyltransferase/sugar lactone lactonase YvrE